MRGERLLFPGARRFGSVASVAFVKVSFAFAVNVQQAFYLTRLVELRMLGRFICHCCSLDIHVTDCCW